jgi:hypothetical protein
MTGETRLAPSIMGLFLSIRFLRVAVLFGFLMGVMRRIGSPNPFSTHPGALLPRAPARR